MIEESEEFKRWTAVSDEILNLLDEFSVFISRDGRRCIPDFAAHREYELAFEGLLHETTDYATTDVALTVDQIRRLVALGKAMNYSAESDMVYKDFLEKYFPDELGNMERE